MYFYCIKCMSNVLHKEINVENEIHIGLGDLS